jgi:hypothetical protein
MLPQGLAQGGKTRAAKHDDHDQRDQHQLAETHPEHRDLV